MKGIILAAGEGTRLRPLTNDIPKCLVPLFGKSILDRQIDVLHSCNIEDIVVVSGYKAEKLNRDDIQIVNNPKYASTNMVETLFCARNHFSDSIIVSYGDIVYTTKTLMSLVESRHDLSVVVDTEWERYWKFRFVNPLDDAESLMMDKSGNILEIGQKTKNLSNIQAQYIGLMKFQNKGITSLVNFYDSVKKNINSLRNNIPIEKSFMTDLLQGLIDYGCEIKSIPIKNGWLEVDSISDYNLYNKAFHNGTLKSFFH